MNDSGRSNAENFFAVPIDDLPRGTASGVDLYVSSRGGFAPYLNSGQRLTNSIRLAIERSGITALYVPVRFTGPFARGYCDAARLVLEAPDSSSEERARVLRSSAGAVARHLDYDPGIQSFQNAREITELLVAEAVKSPDSLTALVKMTYVDQELHAHLVNSSIYAVALSRPLGINNPEQITTIGLACLLYDLGMARTSRSSTVGDPDRDPVVRQHVFVGRDLIPAVAGLPREVRDAALYHHERWDGNGYPAGLRSTRIPLVARIAAVVDTFDRLTTSSSGGQAHRLRRPRRHGPADARPVRPVHPPRPRRRTQRLAQTFPTAAVKSPGVSQDVKQGEW